MKPNKFCARLRLDPLIGILARGLFVLVKPAALWFAIQLDADNGLMLSQVFLIGVGFIALTGTNAHKKYYQARFDQEGVYGRYETASRYLAYIEQIGLQVLPVVFLFIFVSLFCSGASSVVIWFGLIFGIAEKISDEGVRHTQFSLNNVRLLGWALTKLLACWTAILVSWLEWGSISVTFPVMLLAAVLVFGGRGPQLAICKLVKTLLSQPTGAFRNAGSLVKRDIGQIAWVFIGVAFLSFDKWLIQALQPDILPKYMLANQIAGIFLVAQTMVILAPSRVRLITQNPASIPILRFGSGIFCVLALLCGSAVWTLGIQTEALVYMPFFLIGILVLLTPYLERLYWISSDRVRFTTDLSFAMCSFGSFCIYSISCAALRKANYLSSFYPIGT